MVSLRAITDFQDMDVTSTGNGKCVGRAISLKYSI
jgi:hypothetical protein